MSHYCVAVFSNDRNFDRLLEPYDENDERYFEQCQMTTESKNYYKKNYNEAVNNGSFVGTFQEYMEDRGYTVVDDQILYRENPNALYDYYSLDGRDFEFYDLLRDKRIQRPRLHDYKFMKEPTKRELKNHKANWAEICKFADMSDEEYQKHKNEYKHFFSPKYLKERYVNEEQYIKEMSGNYPYCYITPDGVLHAPGRVGWFATDDATAESFNKYYDEWVAFINSDANPYVSFVDCHI